MELALEQAMRERRESSSPQRFSPLQESASKLPVSSPRRVQETSPRDTGVAAQQDVASRAHAKSQADKELQRAEKRNQRLRVHARARSTERRRSPERSLERSHEQQGTTSPEKRSVFRRGRSPERTKQQIQLSSSGPRHKSARRLSGSTDASRQADSAADDVGPEYAADAAGQRTCKHGCGFVGSRHAIVQHEHSCIKAPRRLEGGAIRARQSHSGDDHDGGRSGRVAQEALTMWAEHADTDLRRATHIAAQTGADPDGTSGDPAAALGRSSSRQASAQDSDVESGPDEDGALDQTHDGRSPLASRGKPLCGVITRLPNRVCDLLACCVLGSVSHLSRYRYAYSCSCCDNNFMNRLSSPRIVAGDGVG